MHYTILKHFKKHERAKYSQKRLDHAKTSTADAIKTDSKKSNSKNSRSNGRFSW